MFPFFLLRDVAVVSVGFDHQPHQAKTKKDAFAPVGVAYLTFSALFRDEKPSWKTRLTVLSSKWEFSKAARGSPGVCSRDVIENRTCWCESIIASMKQKLPNFQV